MRALPGGPAKVPSTALIIRAYSTIRQDFFFTIDPITFCIGNSGGDFSNIYGDFSLEPKIRLSNTYFEIYFILWHIFR